MNAPQHAVEAVDSEARMRQVLDAQRADYIAEGAVSADMRRDRLRRGVDVLVQALAVTPGARDGIYASPQGSGC